MYERTPSSYRAELQNELGRVRQRSAANGDSEENLNASSSSDFLGVKRFDAIRNEKLERIQRGNDASDDSRRNQNPGAFQGRLNQQAPGLYNPDPYLKQKNVADAASSFSNLNMAPNSQYS